MRAVLSLLALCACSVSIGDESEVDQTCDSPQYGDGVCQADLACAVPDIDCIQTMPDDAAAAQWFSTIEAGFAQRENRAPRVLIPISDPRHASTRTLLDTGWATFKRLQPVGELAKETPRLVLVEDPVPNAFVVADANLGKVVFSVMVHTGLLELDTSLDAQLWLMMHELQHAVGLHGVQNTKLKMQKYYVAGTSEPLGRDQVDDATTRAQLQAWIDASDEVGLHAEQELGGLPMTGDIYDILERGIARGATVNAANCQAVLTTITNIRKDVLNTRDPLDQSLTVSLATLPSRITNAFTALKTGCIPPNSTLSFMSVAADVAGVTVEQLMEHVPAADLALVTNKHFVDAVIAITTDRRTKMRGYQAMLPGGAPWSSARYFTHEEDADDIATEVIAGAGLDPYAGGEFLLALVGSAGSDPRTRCEAKITAGSVPGYGVNLPDDHHATCWRVHHSRAIADAPDDTDGIASTAQHLHVSREPSVTTRFLPRRQARYEVMY